MSVLPGMRNLKRNPASGSEDYLTPTDRGERLQALDALRGIAILLVVTMHLQLCERLPPQGIDLGRQGVGLFFVISGFLITRNLLSNGDLKRFYLRRTLRIFPPYYLYLLVVGILQAVGWYSITPLSWVTSALYLSNFCTNRGWPLQHTWSLSMEEQFYLSWPLLLRWTGRRHAAKLILLSFLGWPLQRWLRHGSFGQPTAALFNVGYELLLWGCLVALLGDTNWLSLLRRNTMLAASLVCLTLLLVCTSSFPSVVIPILRGLCLATLVARAGSSRSNFAILEPLAQIGRRCYSLYLWHLPWCDPRLVATVSLPTVALGIAICSECSYRWLERPLARWAQQLEPSC